MSSDIAVGIFLQRLLHEKYMEDSKVDVLLQSVIRGVGLNFTTKSSFIQYANNLLSDVGFMLVRVIVAGKRYYSLKDLDSINIGESMQSENAVYLLSQDDLKTPTRKLRDLQNSELATFTQNSTLSESRHVTPFKLYGSKFTNTELIIFIDCINTIIETGKPLSLKNNGTLNTWCYVCSKRSLIDDSAQFALFCRFERKKWLEYEDSGTSIAPGIRFYFVCL
ncbi:hypothetical protein BEWA_011270 [Theileria equi strain WA]|uniref:Uncharacterized protein n=1 Tax=Theileria equi strain WA TaxID=1537102 RepID=L0B3M0_THEEQ|nr:hypothetical protein BEWA_011270 [Theileria equi strain WA]AFZ81709.1 hypothetical protein BEWA_011270 [Theileria equi strain WA]|eukprot:XP_004831375.1 hypothetical protein BEWA_011270 [Theileria equi strain WA]